MGATQKLGGAFKPAAIIRRFIEDETGATAIEYGLLAALVVVGMLIGLSALGTSVENLWEHDRVQITGALGGP